MSPHPATTTPTSCPPHHDCSSSNDSGLSVVTTRATALDVCRSIYGETTAPVPSVDALYEANAIYENPLLTATSRSVIGDIHRLTKQFSSIDIPRPLAALCTLFRLQPPKNALLGWLSGEPLIRALRVWTDVEDVCESESFDSHRKAIVEHTLHILFLPGIHLDGMDQSFSIETSDLHVTPTHDCPPHAPTSPPWLPIPGTSLSVPSPLHFKLHIVTRLSFNEQGLVTHHRDIWDVKDVLGLMPGVSLAQWIGTRIAAAGLSYASRMWSSDCTGDSTARSADPVQYPSKPLATENGIDTTKASEYEHLDIWNSV